MKIINRYLSFCHLRLIGLCLGAFVAIFLVIDFLEKIGKFSRAGATPVQMGTFFACRLPEVMIQVIPLAVLMGSTPFYADPYEIDGVMAPASRPAGRCR